MDKNLNPFIIYAPSIHTGGGKVLLVSLLKALNQLNIYSLLMADVRLSLAEEISKCIKIIRCRSNITGRLFAEYYLKKIAQKNSIVLCFGSLPPLFNLSSKVFIFLQNRYLFKSTPNYASTLKTKIKIDIEKIYLRFFLKNTYSLCVQTFSMKNMVEKEFKLSKEILVIPLVPENLACTQLQDLPLLKSDPLYDFVYVASGETHKNHHNLLLAWKMLADDGQYPTLCLTLDEKKDKAAYEFMEETKKYPNVNIKNFGILSYESVQQLYLNCGALIFPSLCESFGLPLIEAKKNGLSILASELDYVRDLVVPEETFDPGSPVSIYRAVLRYLNIENNTKPFINPTQFIHTLLHY